MRRLGLLFLSGLLLSPPALAQNGRDLPSSRPSRGNGGLDLPERPATQQEGEPSTEAVAPVATLYVSPYWGETTDRAELVFVELEAADEAGELDDARVRQALESLQSFGLRTRDTALKALDSPHMPSVSLAARLLRSVGDLERDDARLLVEVSSGVGRVDVAADCLDAALVIQGALPIRTVDLIAHPRRALRTLAEGRLGDYPDPGFVPSLLRHLKHGRDADIRMRAARLLSGYLGIETARDGLREAIRDESVSVAFTAAEGLAGSAAPAERDYLREQIAQLATGPQLAYLVYALLVQQEITGQLLVDASLADKLEPLIVVRDPFLSGVSAAAVAEYVFRSDVEEGLEDLQRKLPLALVRAVGGSEFYPQYARFSPLAVQSLRRISGQDFTDQDRQAWAEWYAANRENFVLVRGQMAVEQADLPRLMVTWFSSGNAPRSLGGLAAEALAPEAGGRFLGAADAARLGVLLEGTEVLDASVLPGTYGLPEDPIRAGLEIRIAGRRKPMRFRGASGGDWLPQLLKSLDALYREQSWQILGQGPDAAVFLAGAAARWDAASAGERAELLAQWHRERAQTLPPEKLESWAGYLLEHAEYTVGWPLDTAQLFLDRLPEFLSAPEYARRIADAALLHRGIEAMPTVLEALVRLPDPRRAELLSRSLAQLGGEAAAAALDDRRLPVRVAAAQALAESGTAAVPLLLPLLEGEEPLLTRVALQSLGKIGDPQALPAVERLAAPGQPRELRKAAVSALGDYGSASSIALLREAATDEDIGLRLTGLSALRDRPGPEADAAFGEILPRFLGTSLEASFSHALERRGAGLARTVYGRYLGDANPMIVRRVAILAGMLGEPAAVPVLMNLLPSAPTDRELLEALAHASCVDYRSMPDPAGVYEIWWRDHQRQDPSLWLVDGLQGRDFALATDFIEGSGASLATIVRGLLEVLERGPSFLRPAAQLYLTELTGVDRASISPGLPTAAVLEAAQAWHDWLRQH